MLWCRRYKLLLCLVQGLEFDLIMDTFYVILRAMQGTILERFITQGQSDVYVVIVHHKYFVAYTKYEVFAPYLHEWVYDWVTYCQCTLTFGLWYWSLSGI